MCSDVIQQESGATLPGMKPADHPFLVRDVLPTIQSATTASRLTAGKRTLTGVGFALMSGVVAIGWLLAAPSLWLRDGVSFGRDGCQRPGYRDPVTGRSAMFRLGEAQALHAAGCRKAADR